MENITRTYPGSQKNIQVKNYKKRIRRNRRNRKILFGLFLLIVVTLIALFAPWFKINKITVTGNKSIPSSQIIKASTIGYGRNVFRTSIKTAEKGILKLPYVNNVKISRKFPATIKISVTECEVFGYIEFSGTYIYIDTFGRMLEQSKTPPKLNVPLIEKFNLAKFVEGETVTSKDAGKTQYLIDLFSVLKSENIIDRVSLINIPDASSLSITLDNKLEVLIGENSDLDYKIGFLTMKSYENLGQNTRGFLNVSSGDKAVYKNY